MSDPSSQPLTCPTCSGQARETTHMICMGCGTDYAAQPLRKLTGNGLEVLRASLAEVSRLRAENTALREARDGECPRCRFPVWSHDLWKCIPWDMDKHVGDDELRREVVLRELNQGALAGMSSEVTDQAADLVLAALNRYDAWRAEPDPRALGLDQDGRGQADG